MGVALDSTLLFEVDVTDESEPLSPGSRKAADDAALVAHARTGDVGAFEELVRRYRNDVYAVSYHFLRNREEAWDVAQEAFIKAHRSLKRFRGDASFKTWILRIAANHCKDTLKKRRLKTVSIDEMMPYQQPPSGALDPAQELEAQEIGKAIDEALAELPVKHRTAFMLREFQGLSYQEMADTMGCNIGTVMSRLHHARKKLQRLLITAGVVEGETYE